MTIFQRRAYLLAAVFPAVLVTGCAASGNGSMRAVGNVSAASPSTTTYQYMSPPVSPPGTEPETPGEPYESASPYESESPYESGSPTGTASPSPTTTAVQTTPKGTVQGFFDALKAGSVDQVVNAFASDGVAAVAGEPTAQGTQALRTVFKSKMSSMKSATPTFDETITGSDLAFVRTSTSNAEKGRQFFILKKSGSDWKIARFMNNKA
ncbi:nuclear transport factor 2 family protein [Nonomuraea sp. NPDC005983]|uniref:YybH family protein n=1 Tax=Nonomuraea sp. NPDC005983 TaxID=3155595 RepID=UPI0033BB7841